VVAMAFVYMGLGEKEEAFLGLGKSLEERSLGREFLKADPFSDPLRPDQRFQELLRRINLQP
jgi:hypothetical protein